MCLIRYDNMKQKLIIEGLRAKRATQHNYTLLSQLYSTTITIQLNSTQLHQHNYYRHQKSFEFLIHC